MDDGKLQVIPTEFPHIDWAVNKRVPVVAGSRLRVQDVVPHHKAGLTIAKIVDLYPTYSTAEIASAIAYYYQHQQEMDQLIEAHRSRVEHYREQQETAQPASKAQLLARQRST